MSIETLIQEHIEALKANTAILERVVAGQQAAIDKIEGAKTTTTRTRAKKDETPATDAGAAIEQGTAAAEEPATAYTLPIFADVDAFKAYVGKWTGAASEDDRPKLIAYLKSVAGHFGGEGFSGAFAGGAKAVFFIERAQKLGIENVDFNAAYDFDGDPAQDAPAAAAGGSGSGDDFG